MAGTSGAFAPLAATRAGQLGRAVLRARTASLLDSVVAFWIFAGGIILFEPSLYEFAFILVLVLAVAAGMSIYSSTMPLLALTVIFAGFAMIGAFQVRYTGLTQAFLFVAVTVFLFLTSCFLANYVGEAPHRRMAVIRRAYIAIGVVSAGVGTLAYLGLVPNAEFFLRFDRAKGMFKDPNVFGPFLILPAMFLLRDVFFGHRRALLFAAAAFLVVMVGVFVSFSRAAWGHFAASGLLVFGLSFFLEAHARDKVRMIILALVGLMVILIALAGLVSIPEVGALFEQRASATQEYDTGETGRFGRQGYAFELALAHPWGLGPTEFENLLISEQPHNTYVTVLQAYGWGGGICYYLLVLATLWRGISGLRDPAKRALLIPVIAVYIPLAIQSGLIDTDHWRHYFLVVGLIWGITVNANPKGRMGALERTGATF
ncbi:O-antigen ligase family protein [Devosia nitrariae]|uniref:O-antigen polymerase n=1 Tax=Devosia nitrariae TaxID=2071872 RepID=A0ABQ5W546_9HYPH|nr:O-antigen ligase family protein [Devosia nitrariae]GLQ54796.1 O-antigen polymerase [Devosia nitrariae]